MPTLKNLSAGRSSPTNSLDNGTYYYHVSKVHLCSHRVLTSAWDDGVMRSLDTAYMAQTFDLAENRGLDSTSDRDSTVTGDPFKVVTKEQLHMAISDPGLRFEFERSLKN